MSIAIAEFLATTVGKYVLWALVAATLVASVYLKGVTDERSHLTRQREAVEAQAVADQVKSARAIEDALAESASRHRAELAAMSGKVDKFAADMDAKDAADAARPDPLFPDAPPIDHKDQTNARQKTCPQPRPAFDPGDVERLRSIRR